MAVPNVIAFIPGNSKSQRPNLSDTVGVVLPFRMPMPDPFDHWRAFAKWCCINHEVLRTEREHNFAATMCSWPRQPSERQMAWLYAIFVRSRK